MKSYIETTEIKVIAELHACASGAPLLTKIGYLIIREILVVICDHLSVRLHHRKTNVKTSVGASNLILHIHVVVNNIIDSCHNRVFADQNHMTISQAQVWTHQDKVFFEVIPFQLIAYSTLRCSHCLK